MSKRLDKDARPRMREKPSRRRVKKAAPQPDLMLAVIRAVPDNWLDSLLTGPNAVVGAPPYGCPDIEALCKAIRERIRTVFGDLRQESGGEK